MKSKNRYGKRTTIAKTAALNGTDIFETNVFTNKQLEEVLWNTIQDVQSGDLNHESAIAITATARTLCQLAKIRLQAKYLAKMGRPTFIDGTSAELSTQIELPS